MSDIEKIRCPCCGKISNPYAFVELRNLHSGYSHICEKCHKGIPFGEMDAFIIACLIERIEKIEKRIRRLIKQQEAKE